MSMCASLNDFGRLYSFILQRLQKGQSTNTPGFTLHHGRCLGYVVEEKLVRNSEFKSR